MEHFIPLLAVVGFSAICYWLGWMQGRMGTYRQAHSDCVRVEVQKEKDLVEIRIAEREKYTDQVKEQNANALQTMLQVEASRARMNCTNGGWPN